MSVAFPFLAQDFIIAQFGKINGYLLKKVGDLILLDELCEFEFKVQVSEKKMQSIPKLYLGKSMICPHMYASLCARMLMFISAPICF